MAKKKAINHSANTKRFYRALKKSWINTQDHKEDPDEVIKQVFKQAKSHALKKKGISTRKIYSFKYKIFTKTTNIHQKYRVTALGKLVLIPSEGFTGLRELSSYPMYL